LSQLYRMHEFAERAGVTVKALRHYDRLGVLQPRRSGSGYRLYSESDLERLERITALKFLGVPLKQIKAVLDRSGMTLPEALHLQRAVLEDKRQMLGRAIGAIQDAEEALASDRAAEAAAWKRITEVIAMQNNVEAMKIYYSEEAWLKRTRYYEQWPSTDLANLFREISASLGANSAGEKAQALKLRWRQLLNDTVTGDPEVQVGALAAWNDREHWPAAMREKVRELRMEEAIEFLAQAMAASWKKYITSAEWRNLPEQRRHPAEPWNQWILRVQMALEEEPPGENARALVVRAMEL
jgi:MerR family transcriptional regulator, thiopeptide resistance regulator